jgi:ABC-2 type transport system permease protein
MSIQANLSALAATTHIRLITISRYQGQMVSEIIIPIVFAAMPILLGRAGGGENAEAIFEANTGTANYVAYMLIGSSVFSIVSNAFWHIAYWLRREQQIRHAGIALSRSDRARSGWSPVRPCTAAFVQ